jgi:hypothetical protein
MKERRIVAVEQVPMDKRKFVESCFYCCPKHHPTPVKAVAAVEVMELWGIGPLFFGICGNHAEVYPFTEEEVKKRPMVCPHCFPRHKSS